MRRAYRDLAGRIPIGRLDAHLWIASSNGGGTMTLLERLHFEEDGATAVEYAVMLALILVVCLVAIRQVGQTASSEWGSNQASLNIAWTAAGGS
jgi:pilus assembly protein Flp/PilA